LPGPGFAYGLLAAMAFNGIQAVIAQTIPFAEAVQAWYAIQKGEQPGKILIRVS
jgi:hypothetical protein